eukprot:13900659-Alexandrium_andersonii.AAC.1
MSTERQDVQPVLVQQHRAEVAKRMSSGDDPWDVDTSAYEEFERTYSDYLLERFKVLRKFTQI